MIQLEKSESERAVALWHLVRVRQGWACVVRVAELVSIRITTERCAALDKIANVPNLVAVGVDLPVPVPCHDSSESRKLLLRRDELPQRKLCVATEASKMCDRPGPRTPPRPEPSLAPAHGTLAPPDVGCSPLGNCHRHPLRRPRLCLAGRSQRCRATGEDAVRTTDITQTA
jgi:hypothetical protein